MSGGKAPAPVDPPGAIAATPGSVADTLWNIEQIRQLKSRYFRALDNKDWDLFQDVFTREVAITNKRAGLERRLQREDQVLYIRQLIGAGRSIHHGYSPEIELIDETTAAGIWAMDDVIIYPPSENPQGFRGWGYYHDTYRVEDGAWRIAATDLQRIRFEPLPGGLPPTVDPSVCDKHLVWSRL